MTKDFIRNGKRVPFSDQWKRLNEAVGFEYMYSIRAWQVNHKGTQAGWDGDREIKTVNKSFFRQIYEKAGGPAIDYEEVVFLRKP